MRLIILSMAFAFWGYLGTQAFAQTKDKVSFSFATEPVGTTSGAEKVNFQGYGAGQWKEPVKIYNVLCAQCHDPQHPIGPELLGRRFPASALKVLVRQGIQTMPPFFSTEISDEELEALGNWVQNSPAPKNGGQ